MAAHRRFRFCVVTAQAGSGFTLPEPFAETLAPVVERLAGM
jgi:hypothetical protein